MINIRIPAARPPRTSTDHKMRASLVIGAGAAYLLVGSYLLAAARDMATVERQRAIANDAANRMLARLDERDRAGAATATAPRCVECDRVLVGPSLRCPLCGLTTGGDS